MWVCLLAGVGPAVSGLRGADFAPITLYTQFRETPPEGVVRALEEEVEALMGPIGLRFQWRSLSENSPREVSAELAVITFQGRCDAAGLSAGAKGGGALGWTHVSDGEILPFTDVSCDRVREFTQVGLLGVRAGDRASRYGRALGRVLAHELYHIFAKTAHHASAGVAKEAYSVQDLLDDDFQFHAKETRKLQASRPKVEEAPLGTR